ncbi:DUF5957 family protein [Actinoalloteichus caeruleus]|uniref:Uncharacterized protein n=1 Tax=Actinoalloteichus caeruleus DSM 43889 TaxID=1120930 RepID=A0ABT1JQ50_ACTCY|nr:DUF5957 family protein [Actinoalloteichus caeruleus]MCP2334304.1 hypothetical protein [Actinoalloteichus caeruleus DSM 43889]
MRTVGIVVLGLFAGWIAGFLVGELLARTAQVTGYQGGPLVVVVGLAPQVGSLLGVVVAVLVDSRRRRDGSGR